LRVLIGKHNRAMRVVGSTTEIGGHVGRVDVFGRRFTSDGGKFRRGEDDGCGVGTSRHGVGAMAAISRELVLDYGVLDDVGPRKCRREGHGHSGVATWADAVGDSIQLHLGRREGGCIVGTSRHGCRSDCGGFARNGAQLRIVGRRGSEKVSTRWDTGTAVLQRWQSCGDSIRLHVGQIEVKELD